jgi:tetratricopeptide (TPR) repeat protein
MSDKKTEHVEKNDAVNKLDAFWRKNQKAITIAALAVIVLVGGWYAYKNYVVKPKEEKAQAAIFMAEQYFRTDSFKLALNGDGANKGVLYVIKNFGGTETAELAHYYAGVSYLQLDDYDNAIKYLKDYSTDARQVQARAWSCLADAYSSKGDKSKAIDLYKKAGRYFPEDDVNSPEYLFRAAQLLELDNKADQAVDVYKEIKESFPRSEKGSQADKYINRLKVQKNEFSVN